MHERSAKETAIDVIFYERDLLRHCAKTIDAKRQQAESSSSQADKAEYYLAIEGFLLHFRNLLGFFINKRMQPTDLTLNRSDQWTNGRAVDEAFCKKLTERAEKLNQEHGLAADVDCYKKISWFLQHCTDHRYKLQRDWDIARMFSDINPILDDFEATITPSSKLVQQVITLGRADYGTATISKT